jgi:hypothetical protein
VQGDRKELVLIFSTIVPAFAGWDWRKRWKTSVNLFDYAVCQYDFSLVEIVLKSDLACEYKKFQIILITVP